MIRNIVFGGCSITWGQSLHYHGAFKDDIHPKDGKFYQDKIKYHHYQYMVDNRFATRVADYFGRKAIVNAQNGGSNCTIAKNLEKMVDGYTDAVIIQTTGFDRCKDKTIAEQFDEFISLLNKFESENKLVRFIHWDIDEESIPREILEKTIYIENNPTFWNLIMNKESKYTIRHTFGYPDQHLNILGHKVFTSEIIKSLEPYINKPIYN